MAERSGRVPGPRYVFARVIKGIVVSVTDFMQQLHVFPSPDHVLSINETREGCIYIVIFIFIYVHIEWIYICIRGFVAISASERNPV